MRPACPGVFFGFESSSRRRRRRIADRAKVAELVDALDLGSSAARRGGSSPPFRTRPRSSCGLFEATASPSEGELSPAKPWPSRATCPVALCGSASDRARGAVPARDQPAACVKQERALARENCARESWPFPAKGPSVLRRVVRYRTQPARGADEANDEPEPGSSS